MAWISGLDVLQRAGSRGFLLVLFLTPATALASSSFIIRRATTARTPYDEAHHPALPAHISTAFRGGASQGPPMSSFFSTLGKWKSSPQALFNTTLFALGLTAVLWKILQRVNSPSETVEQKKKPESVQSLQRRFLPVFWMLRCSDWLQGPYFYEVYASKVFNGVQASMSLVSQLFLTGFASTALFGPSVGRAADQFGRKKATLAFSIIYALAAFSTKSSILQVLFLGRTLSGIGTSLLFSAPEAWLVGEAQKSGDDPDGEYLGETFGMAYAGDSVVAILAGQLAGLAAAERGSTGPFELSSVVLLLGGLMTALLWQENKATSNNSSNKKPSIADAVQKVRDNPKILLVGAVQSLFEAAMYIFVLQWPPAMATAIKSAYGDTSIPYGTIFSCFMACSLLGSTLFGQLTRMAVPTESFTATMLTVATVAMTGATWMVSSSSPYALLGLIASFFCFEACVGMYFPSIGTLRSKYVPDSHRSVIMNLFGIPLNVLVVSVFLSIQRLGLQGALSISSGALGLAAFCMIQLRRMVRQDDATP